MPRPLSSGFLLVGTILLGVTQTPLASAQAMTEQVVPRAHLNLDKQGIALSGFDPVSYFTGKPAKGLSALSANHGGAIYLFASDTNRKAFQANPAKFLPAYGGWCAYAMADGKKVEVDPMTFKIKDGRLLLFYHSFLVNTLTKWNAEEGKFYPLAEKHWDQILKGP
jgi:YHS domain-containing protein